MTGTKIGSGYRCAFANLAFAILVAACGGGDGTDVATNSPGVAPPASPATNAAPTIAGSAPTSIQTGQAYAFQPSAQDADNDTVTFVVANKPAWATFDAATGKLHGTPQPGDVGSYASIEISATDGTAVSSLPSFSITVSAPAALAKAVTLEWQAPTENLDGTTVDNLKGYKIHYGSESQAYSETIAVTNPSITRYVLDTLPPGKYYFALTATSQYGLDSPLSNEVSTTLN